jgi:hypothetical protein
MIEKITQNKIVIGILKVLCLISAVISVPASFQIVAILPFMFNFNILFLLLSPLIFLPIVFLIKSYNYLSKITNNNSINTRKISIMLLVIPTLTILYSYYLHVLWSELG